MAIRLETSKKRGIVNFQDSEVNEQNRRWFTAVERRHPKAIPRTEPTAIFNCHGLTFACRRTRILDWRNIAKILEDDSWKELKIDDILPGDIEIRSGLTTAKPLAYDHATTIC